MFLHLKWNCTCPAQRDEMLPFASPLFQGPHFLYACISLLSLLHHFGVSQTSRSFQRNGSRYYKDFHIQKVLPSGLIDGLVCIEFSLRNYFFSQF